MTNQRLLLWEALHKVHRDNFFSVIRSLGMIFATSNPATLFPSLVAPGTRTVQILPHARTKPRYLFVVVDSLLQLALKPSQLVARVGLPARHLVTAEVQVRVEDDRSELRGRAADRECVEPTCNGQWSHTQCAGCALKWSQGTSPHHKKFYLAPNFGLKTFYFLLLVKLPIERVL